MTYPHTNVDYMSEGITRGAGNGERRNHGRLSNHHYAVRAVGRGAGSAGEKVRRRVQTNFVGDPPGRNIKEQY